jgi:hypothetical protein
MAKVRIGGKDYLISELNFIALEKAWDAIESFMQDSTINPIRACSLTIKIVSAGLQEEVGFNRADFEIKPEEVLTPQELDARIETFLKRQVKGNELPDLQVSVMEILEEAGLMAGEGEFQETLRSLKELTASMATLVASSQSLSQPESKEVAGTE